MAPGQHPVTAWAAVTPVSLRDAVPRARPYAPPVADLTPLDMIRDGFPGWDLGEAGGVFWGFRLDDPPGTLTWGITPALLADAIRANGGAR